MTVSLRKDTIIWEKRSCFGRHQARSYDHLLRRSYVRRGIPWVEEPGELQAVTPTGGEIFNYVVCVFLRFGVITSPAFTTAFPEIVFISVEDFCA